MIIIYKKFYKSFSLLRGGNLKLNYVCMLDDSSYRMLVAEGEIVHAENPKVNYRSMIDDIVSGLKSGEIQSHKRCNAKEFICLQWTKSPDLFTLNPHHHTLGPYS